MKRMADRDRGGDRSGKSKRGDRPAHGEQTPVRGARERFKADAAPRSRGSGAGKVVADAGRPRRNAQLATAAQKPSKAKPAAERTWAATQPAKLDKAFIEMMAKLGTKPR